MWRLNVLIFIATAVYAILDVFLDIHVEYYVYLSFFLFATINAVLIRFEYLEISKVFSLSLFNIMVFLVATSEPYSTGMYLQFVSAGTVALAVYGYEQWKGAVIFVLLSLVLDIIVFSTDISIIPWREVTPGQASVFFVLNTVIATSVCVYTFMMYAKINHDSERMLQENEQLIIKQNEQLLKANSELDRFVYSASHDLRAPLSTLKGLINLSESEKDNNLKNDYLELMKERIRSMDTFISEIIDYSRNSRLELKKENINIKELLHTVVKELQYLEGSDKIEIKWELPAEEMIIKSDPLRLKMVFTNLISNAIKYHDPEKEHCWVKIEGKSGNGSILISISDNGLGIQEDLQKHVFEMFFRAHENSTGSGLGLYIANETIQKLSGNLSMESAKGKGSTFRVKIPLKIGAKTLAGVSNLQDSLVNERT